MSEIQAVLEVQDLSAGYRRADVLRDISLGVAAGEVVAIAGPNGSGKSTFLRAITGRVPRLEGQIRWFGQSLGQFGHRHLARRVAMLPQLPTHLPRDRVRDVLAAGRTPHLGLLGVESVRDARAVEEVAQSLGLADWLDREIATLSGGQRQRVFIGRCVVQLHGAMQAAILLDEPDTYLDLRHAAELANLIRSLAKERGLATIVASHDLNLAAGVADRMALLNDGRLVTMGAPAEVLEPGRISDIFQTRVKVIDVDGRPVVVAGA